MRFKAFLWALAVTAITTLHGLAALWCWPLQLSGHFSSKLYIAQR